MCDTVDSEDANNAKVREAIEKYNSMILKRTRTKSANGTETVTDTEADGTDAAQSAIFLDRSNRSVVMKGLDITNQSLRES